MSCPPKSRGFNLLRLAELGHCPWDALDAPAEYAAAIINQGRLDERTHRGLG